MKTQAEKLRRKNGQFKRDKYQEYFGCSEAQYKAANPEGPGKPELPRVKDVDPPDDGPDGFELPDGSETWQGSTATPGKRELPPIAETDSHQGRMIRANRARRAKREATRAKHRAAMEARIDPGLAKWKEAEQYQAQVKAQHSPNQFGTRDGRPTLILGDNRNTQEKLRCAQVQIVCDQEAIGALKASAEKLAAALREILPLATHKHSCPQVGNFGLTKCNCGAHTAVPNARAALAAWEAGQ